MSLCILGRFYSPGFRDIFHSLEPEASHQPVSNGVPCWSHMMMALNVKVTVQLASNSAPTPITVWRKPGMGCPLIGNPNRRWGMSKSPVPVEFWVCPVDVPILTFCSKRSMLTTGASVEK